MPAFQKLYDLALELLTSDRASELGRLSYHSGKSLDSAHGIIRNAVLTRIMPGEKATSDIEVLRIFMRNLVNRAQAPLPAVDMLRILNDVNSRLSSFDEFCAELFRCFPFPKNPDINRSLVDLLTPKRNPGLQNSYIDWLMWLVARYENIPAEDIDENALLNQIGCMANPGAHKIRNMGVALASNLLADLGIRASVKPDLHILAVIRGVTDNQNLTEMDCIREVIRVAKDDARVLNGSAELSWLSGGIYPRDIDRMIFIIGSDNFFLDGRQLKRYAPERRQLIIKKLMQTRSNRDAEKEYFGDVFSAEEKMITFSDKQKVMPSQNSVVNQSTIARAEHGVLGHRMYVDTRLQTFIARCNPAQKEIFTNLMNAIYKTDLRHMDQYTVGEYTGQADGWIGPRLVFASKKPNGTRAAAHSFVLSIALDPANVRLNAIVSISSNFGASRDSWSPGIDEFINFLNDFNNRRHIADLVAKINPGGLRERGSPYVPFDYERL